MGGEGSMQAMNTILRNNRNLLRKKSMFKRDQSFFKARKEYLKAANGEIDFKKISKSELRKIREKVIKERKFENLRVWMITLAILIPIIVFGVYISNQFKIENEQHFEQEQLIIAEHQFDKKMDSYDFFIEEGDKWIEKKNWRNAIYQYNNAVKVFPKKYEANYRLALAYSYNCKFENKDCEKGNRLVDRLLKVAPNDKDLRILKKIVTE